MLGKEDWMDIKAQVSKGVYLKDIARELGVHLEAGGPGREGASWIRSSPWWTGCCRRGCGTQW